MRRESKPEIEVPRQVTFALGVGDEAEVGSIVRLSVAGVEVVAMSAPAVGREVHLRTVLVDGEGEVVLHGRVQWSQPGQAGAPGRFAVQFGSLGARATNAIVQASQRVAV